MKWKKQEGGFLGDLIAPLATSLEQPVISSVVKGISGTEVRREGRGYIFISTPSFKQYRDY